MFERFTERARQVVLLASEEARALRHNDVAPEHLLLGLLRAEDGIAARVLDLLEVAIEDVRNEVARRAFVVRSGEAECAPGLPSFTPDANRVLELALREALSLGHNYIGTEHILLGLVRAGSGGSAILYALGASRERVRHEVIRMASGRTVSATHSRSDVSVGQIVTKGDGVYRIIGIADEPTVTLENVASGEREHYVVTSPLFAEFDLLTPA